MEYAKLFKQIDYQTNMALIKAKDLQPFENHYIWRAAEFKNLLYQAGVDKWGNVLEVGCGNAFNSSLIASISNKVIATDLGSPDRSTESMGIDKALQLTRRVGLRNCTVISSSAESLSFKDESFDIVYSSYTLEHIAGRSQAISEMARVLKKGGLLIATVPNFVERLTYIPVYYNYIMRRALFHGYKMAKSIFIRSSIDNRNIEKDSIKTYQLKTPWNNNRNFPFPDIHGVYATFSNELISSLFYKWSRIFTRKDLKQVKSFTTIIMPWHLFSLINTSLPLWLYTKSSFLQRKIGSLPLLNIIGHNLCFIYEKR
ncbi:MAG: class I SAM-dependent methyltransferase [Candidatus Omnitrophica bacterium]|nr:class I SAM-dependent methyltransferase [Candidatus Omnitrophota bacterium]